MKPDTSFATLVKQRRVALGMSQAKLADLVGRSSSVVRSWERGASAPADENVVRSLAAVLGIEESLLRSSVGLDPKGRVREPDEIGGGSLEVFVAEVDDPGEPVGVDVPRGTADVEEGPEAGPAEPAGAGQTSEEIKEPAVKAPPAAEDDHPPPAAQEELLVADEPLEADFAFSAPPTGAPEEESPVAGGTGATSPTVMVPAGGTPVLPAERSYLDDPDQMVTYWIRAALTVAFSVFLLVVLLWALSRLGDSVGEVWDIFEAGA